MTASWLLRVTTVGLETILVPLRDWRALTTTLNWAAEKTAVVTCDTSMVFARESRLTSACVTELVMVVPVVAVVVLVLVSVLVGGPLPAVKTELLPLVVRLPLVGALTLLKVVLLLSPRLALVPVF